MSTGSEEQLLAKLAANHILLSQFELARAALRQLHVINAARTERFLTSVVERGGNLPNVLWSPAAPSPAHLAWLCCSELQALNATCDRDDAEFHLLLALLREPASALQPLAREAGGADNGDSMEDNETSDAVEALRAISDRRLWGIYTVPKSQGDPNPESDEPPPPLDSTETDGGLSEGALAVLNLLIGEEADIFQALSINAARRQPGSGSKEAVRKGRGLSVMHGLVQSAHVTAVTQLAASGSLVEAVGRLRYLCYEFGAQETGPYRHMFHTIVGAIERSQLRWRECQAQLAEVYEAVLANGSVPLVALLEAVQDERQHEEAVANDALAAPPLERLHLALTQMRQRANGRGRMGLGAAGLVDMKMELVERAAGEIFQFARIEGQHVLALSLEGALLAVENNHFQKAADILEPFPSLKPLAAALGWDLLAGDTEARRRMMQLLWIEGRASRTNQDAPPGQQQPEEASCIEQLCEQLWYRLEVSRKVRGRCGGESAEFIGKLVVEKMAIHSPLRVLFDVAPNMSMTPKEMLDLVSSQPIGGGATSAQQRQWDVELLHLHYGVQAAARAFSQKDTHSTERGHAGEALRDLKGYLEAIETPARKLWLLGLITDLLHMDAMRTHSQPPPGRDPMLMATGLLTAGRSGSLQVAEPEEPSPAVECIGAVLKLLRAHMPPPGSPLLAPEVACPLLPPLHVEGGALIAGEDMAAPAWRAKALRLGGVVEEWEWRLEVLSRMRGGRLGGWQWQEALAVLRAAPSTLLNMCVQQAAYALGEEAVHRFALPPEEAASLQLAQWVEQAVAQASVDGAISRVAKGEEALDFKALHAQLTPLASVLLCLDAAAASARSATTAVRLLEQAKTLLPQCEPVPHDATSALTVEVAKRFLQRLFAMQNENVAQPLQALLSGFDPTDPGPPGGSGGKASGPRPRAVVLLQQTMEDCYGGKRQFLSGKLHNLVRALAVGGGEEGGEDPVVAAMNPLRWGENLKPPAPQGLGLDIGLLPAGGTAAAGTPSVGLTPGSGTSQTSSSAATGPATPSPIAPQRTNISVTPATSSGGALRGVKPKAYLPAFILYVAEVGDIVDDTDSTHMFNFFSLIYERPTDLLPRLVFERNSVVAASKVAALMGADLVHEVISACVPPVYPPRNSMGWARIQRPPPPQPSETGPVEGKEGGAGGLHPLKLDVIKHLHQTSPLRALLACVFGSTRFTSPGGERGMLFLPVPTEGGGMRGSEEDKKFFGFALEQSVEYPTLNRWIELQTHIRKLSDDAPGGGGGGGKGEVPAPPLRSWADGQVAELSQSVGGKRWRLKRRRPQEVEAEAGIASEPLRVPPGLDSLLSDWESQGPFQEAMGAFIRAGQLRQALDLADRWLPDGAPDELLQMLIEEAGRESPVAKRGKQEGGKNLAEDSWQHCIRLRDKEVAAELALKHLERWNLAPALEVLELCLCHLSATSPVYERLLSAEERLHRCQHILGADSQLRGWQEVEEYCRVDAEGLALRLAERGAVGAAVEVAQACQLGPELTQELQGRHLSMVLGGDPVTGGGAAAGLRYLEGVEDASCVAVGMAGVGQMESLHLKQVVVGYLLRRRRGAMEEEEVAAVEGHALGLRVLQGLPKAWQVRCGGLHGTPELVLETMLMWKQTQLVGKVVREFESLRNDSLMLTYASKALAPAPPPGRISVSPPLTPPKSPLGRIEGGGGGGFSRLHKVFPWTARESPADGYTTPPLGSPSGISTGDDSGSGGGEGQVPGAAAAAAGAAVGVQEYILSGDSVRDEGVRRGHRYENTPSPALFRSILGLCFDQVGAAKTALTFCGDLIQRHLSAEEVAGGSRSTEVAEETLHLTGAFVEALQHICLLLRRHLAGTDTPTGEEAASESGVSAEEEGEVGGGGGGQPVSRLPCPYWERSSSRDSSPSQGPLGSSSNLQASVLGGLGGSSRGSTGGVEEGALGEAERVLAQLEVLQRLLGENVVASIEDVRSEERVVATRDWLVGEERYQLATLLCAKCRVDPTPVYVAWGQSLLLLEKYEEARGKFKQAVALWGGGAGEVVRHVVETLERWLPTNVKAAQGLLERTEMSVAYSEQEALSTDSYLDALNLATPTRGGGSGGSQRFSYATDYRFRPPPPAAPLGETRFEECVFYLDQYARHDLLPFLFRYGHYREACLLLFPTHSVPPPPSPLSIAAHSASSSPQRPDPLATDFGSIDDLCALAVAYDCCPLMALLLVERGNWETVIKCLQGGGGGGGGAGPVVLHTVAVLGRICVHFETHRQFHHLYIFQELQRDHVAAGMSSIQLFLNAGKQEEAVRHLQHAKAHFEEGRVARQVSADVSRPRSGRSRSAASKVTEEEMIKLKVLSELQIDVLATLGGGGRPPWALSLFGNPNDHETQDRRLDVAQMLVERSFDLAFRCILELGLPAAQIYAGVAASMAQRRRSAQLWELLRKNVKGSLDDSDWDQVLLVAIRVYASKHRERPDRLIEQIVDDHRKVLAYVACGRLKSAFQVATHANNETDVQYVFHELSMQSKDSPAVREMCRSWLAARGIQVTMNRRANR